MSFCSQGSTVAQQPAALEQRASTCRLERRASTLKLQQDLLNRKEKMRKRNL